MPVDKLAEEVYAFMRSLNGAMTLVKLEPPQFPLLGQMKAFARYLLGGKVA